MSGLRDYEILDQLIDKLTEQAKENQRLITEKREKSYETSKLNEKISSLEQELRDTEAVKETFKGFYEILLGDIQRIMAGTYQPLWSWEEQLKDLYDKVTRT